MDPALEQLARRYTGTVERLYTLCRHGVILAATGERLTFRRLDVLGHGRPWTPRSGQAVLFDRFLDRKGLHAVKVRPLRAREPAAAPPGRRPPDTPEPA